MAQFFDFEQDYYGLSDAEIEKKLSMYGLNTYYRDDKQERNPSPWEILLSPAVILMFIASVMCFIEAQIGAGIIALLVDAVYVAAEIYARKYADKCLDDINASTVMKFRVIRRGRLELVPKEDIVPEDMIVLQAGERIPADAFIHESRDLTVDESVFTGDHTPSAKYEGGISKSDLKPNMVYSGTIVLTGTAICKVTATGVDTRLYQQLGEAPESHPYYTAMERIVRALIPVAGCVAVVMTLASVIIRLNTENSIVSSILSGLSMGLCFVPVGLGSIIRLNYTKCAMDLLKNGAVVKSFSDIEKLNSLSVLCVEKEGAISKSRLEVRGIYARSEELLYRVAALAGEPNCQDPTIKALMVKAAFFDERIKEVYNENTFIEKIPDSNESLSGAIWSVGGDKLCCIKGVPEQILPMCKMSGDALHAAKKRCEDYYAKGCSVMAVACVDASQEITDLTAGFSYMFIGFAAFSAPLRDSVSTAVKTCRRAGMRVVMLTEENPSVAESTGKMIGIQSGNVVTGTQIEAARNGGSPLDLKSDIYAKLNSEQKKYVIEQLKESGEVVAMAGTRPDDACVLEAADVGITIAQTAAGCTYEIADILMNDDNFNTIADMIASARQVHRNIKSAVSVIIGGVAALILIMIVNAFSGMEHMLIPPVIALVGFVFMPLCAVSFQGKSSNQKTVMPPSSFVAKRKLNVRFIGRASLFGVLMGTAAVSTYLFMNNGNADFARSCSLVSLCTAMAAFVLLQHIGDQSLRSLSALRGFEKVIVGVVLLVPILLVYVPFLNHAFGLRAIDMLALFISLVTGIVPAVIYRVIKVFIKFKEQS